MSVRPREHAVRRRAAGAAALLGLAAALAGPAAAQEVNVRYPNRAGTVEAWGGSGPSLTRSGTLVEFTRIVQDLGRLYLKPGDRLDVTVLRLDVAGIRLYDTQVALGPRIVNGTTAPQIQLAYTLTRGGRVAARGTEFVTDPLFQITQNPGYSAGPLYYEKRILTGWFEDRFRYGLPPSSAAR